ncbi:MFS transporter [Streptomyces sp. NPDC005799]|uniref:MFS transporter n=1 Tax=Streptomyces sp. NPDC005799 TaxID=3154678 RepID=UPI0033D37EF3
MTSTSSQQAADSTVDQRSSRLILAALAVAGSLVAVHQTTVTPLLPDLARHFDTSLTAVSWVFTAPLLTGAVATPLLSRLGDMYGKRPLIQLTLSLLLTGSVVCAFAPSLGVLIAGRALQGVSVALFPLAIGLIREVLPPDRVMNGIGVVSATMGVGGTLGMIITGLVTAVTDGFRPVFWVAIILSVTALTLIARWVPSGGARHGGKPDYPGAALLALTLVCLLLAISKGNTWGWTSGRVLTLFGAAVLLGGAWTLTERRVTQPLVKLSLLVGHRSLSANTLSLLLGFSMYASFTLVANLVQTPRRAGYGLGGSILDVGLYSLPMMVTTLSAAGLASRLARRIGQAFTIALGAVISGCSFLWLALSNTHGYDFLGQGALQGLGLGISQAALGVLAVEHVPLAQSGIASGINSLVRTAGGAIAGAAVGAVLGGGAATLHDYVLCFFFIAGTSWLAGLIAVAHRFAYNGNTARPLPSARTP